MGGEERSLNLRVFQGNAVNTENEIQKRAFSCGKVTNSGENFKERRTGDGLKTSQ